MLPINDITLIPFYSYALSIISKAEYNRDEYEKRFLETDEHVVRFLENCAEEDMERALINEIARLRSLRPDVEPGLSNSSIRVPEVDAGDNLAEPNTAVKAELAAMESELLEHWKTRRAEIARKHGYEVKSLAPAKLPFLRKNTGKVTGFNVFQKELYCEQGC
ncbi:hypothetical protein BDB00DRAFT_153954 [Zychaea mexicana]|uniref:uncharacterized protein n=1 Tax=Zychaea mexicana TaxID=64656 RepID=UPI0022FE603A|nr:uncharacterized protein BDB00DRAFT_153954 [Zychaea mexicana]KAI9484339.1 hypothetical protein BDB00DRAFT_153954 [Zychaea mexicana]